jgi:pSer/pThr/pTyr-binding forkhead associated (FHA) protein
MNRLIRGVGTLIKPSKVAAELVSAPVGEQAVMVTPIRPTRRQGIQDLYVGKQVMVGNPYITLQLEGTSERSKPVSFNASEDRRIIIGRASDCDVCLAENMASRKHAMIIYDLFRGWMLQDLGSTNGVFLNGTIVENTGLKVGDRIKIGSTEILVCEVTGSDSAG